MTTAALLLAAALLVGAVPTRVRGGKPTASQTLPDPTPEVSDPLAVASALDVFAACLASGMAVSTAAAAAAPSAPRPLAKVLARAADLLALGSDPATAWADPELSLDNHGAALLRLARRSAASGIALAQGVTDLADSSRHDAASAADAKAQRASVLIAGPLGLCYLPAFICLGIVPIVAGLAGDVLRSGLI
ncbi:MAG TPA: type II secretion system F family protein [Mycobacterium sp.]|jgi:pilus assembly protein TadC|nr:type II secretion system F family protein [Mycobacterium sp.]